MKSSPRRVRLTPKLFSRTLLAASSSLLLLAPLPPSASRSAGDGIKTIPNTANPYYPGRAVAPLAALDEDDDTPHLLASTYYSSRGGLRATLMLNNKGPHPLPVEVTLFSAGGERLHAPTVTVEGSSFRELDLGEMAGANPSFAEGSVQVFYRGHDLMLGAQVYLVDESRSLVFEEKLLELDGSFASRQLESVWWMPSRGCEARLVVSNTGDAPLAVTAGVEGSRPKQKEPATLALAPHETRVVDVLLDLVGTPAGQLMEAGGVSLGHDGAPGALMARMLIQDRGVGYSSWARFLDPQKGKSTKLQGAGLRLGSFAGERLTPGAVARNVGDAEAVISGRVPYTLADGQTGVVSLPELRLAPGEARTFDLDKALRKSGVALAGAAAGLEFEHTGAPGGVLLSAQSVSASRDHVFHVPVWDIEGQKSSTGGYPWKVEGDTSTVVYIKNVTGREQRYTWQLRHEGGTYSLGLRTIGPYQTHAIDTRDLRDRRVPDEKGRTIPPDATRGQIHWSTRGAENLALIGRAEQADAALGLATSYACQNCCPDSFYEALTTNCLDPLFVSETSQLLPSQRDISCYGQVYDGYGVGGLAEWLSFNTSVASVDQYGGLAEGEGAGDTSIRAAWEAEVWGHEPFTVSCKPTIQQAAANALCPVSGIAVDVSPNEIRPSGTGGTNTATVTIRTFPRAVEGVSVALALGSVQDSGGHFNHLGVRPNGTLAQEHGVTDASGRFTTTYTAPIFGGVVRIAAVGTNAENTVTVRVPGLASLGGGANYNLIGASTEHPDNHYGTATALQNLPLIADDYKAMFYPNVAIPNSEKMEFNDMSLVNGGKFDLGRSWGQNDDHQEHLTGTNCDVRSINIPSGRHAAVEQFFVNRGSPNFLKHPSPPHWHLRF